ncbi:MAG TPA: hypothetical protein VKZ58_05670 [Longimicrobiales bacterium]|nr:hypothetical protein [Longimicrobiales bacterium]
MTIGRAGRAGVGVALLLAGVAVGCNDDDGFGPVQVRFDKGFFEGKALIGLWTGTEEILESKDVFSSAPGGSSTGPGFAFPVALRLEPFGRFTLWTFNFPVDGDGSRDRFCEGVFALHGRVIEFFPDRACRALPLSRFRQVRGFPDALVLEAESGPGGIRKPDTDVVSIRVRLTLRRD